MSSQPEAQNTAPGSPNSFHVRLTNFEGPFDLLLQLISKHKLDVTEVALHEVTDDFIAHIREMGDAWNLDQASEFLLIAATLLDLKAARLLPSATVDDEEDLALLEARDLLFARLLQYRAYKEAADWVSSKLGEAGRRYPRAVTLEPRYAELMPEVLLGVGVERFSALAVEVFTPREPPTVSISHIHAPAVSVREHAATLRERLAVSGASTFRVLTSDCANTLEVVARFLALLELYREQYVSFEQIEPLSELHVRWLDKEPDVPLRVDEYHGTPDEPQEVES